jgi:hypothetical protein
MRIRSFVVTLVAITALSLVPASPALADDSTADLLLTRSACTGASDILKLDFELQAYTGSCGDALAFATGGQTDTYASDKLTPFTLDTSRPISVAIKLSTQGGLVAVGDQKVTIDLSATDAKGKGVALGSAEATKAAADMLRGGNYTQTFSLPLTAAKGGPYKSFSLDLTVGGSVLGSYVNNGGASLVSLPIFDPLAE